MDEFDCSLHYIEGKKNVLANCFSQLPIMRSIPVRNSNNNNNKRKQIGTPVKFHTIKVPKGDTMIDDKSYFTLEELYVKDDRINVNRDANFHIDEDQEMTDLFLNLPAMGKMQYSVSMQNILNHQQQDAELQQQHQYNPILFSMQNMNGVNILTMCSNPAQPTLWKTYLPTILVANMIHWYHVTLGHVALATVMNAT